MARYLDQRPHERLDIPLTRTRNTVHPPRVSRRSFQIRDDDWQKARRPCPHAVILSSPARDFFARKTIPSSCSPPRCSLSPRTPTTTSLASNLLLLADESHPPHHSTRPPAPAHTLSPESRSLYHPHPTTTNSPDTTPTFPTFLLLSLKPKRPLKMSLRTSTSRALKQALQSTTQKRSFSLVAKAGVAAAARPQVVRPVVNVSATSEMGI